MDTCENLCTVSIHLIPWQDTGCALHCRTVYDVYMFSMAISQRRRNEFSMDVERIEGWNDYALKISRQAPQQHCSLLSKGAKGSLVVGTDPKPPPHAVSLTNKRPAHSTDTDLGCLKMQECETVLDSPDQDSSGCMV